MSLRRIGGGLLAGLGVLVPLVAQITNFQISDAWAPELFGLCVIVGIAGLVLALWPGKPDGEIEELGGAGGDAKVGGSGMAIGGRAGKGGPPGSGKGGAGGRAEVNGDGIAIGGDGGEAGQADRGGNGGQSPLLRLKELGLETGGTRLSLLIQSLQQEYTRGHISSSVVPAETVTVPDEWMNDRLRERGMNWRYETTSSGYHLFAPSSHQDGSHRDG